MIRTNESQPQYFVGLIAIRLEFLCLLFYQERDKQMVVHIGNEQLACL